MTLATRRVLSVIFILIFITVTPAIMLYAAGYRLGRNGFSVQRTGMFIIDSEPQGAKILIDGAPQENWYSAIFHKNNFLTTPAKINNLLPGDYNLKLELDGYWSWQKKLAVSPGASTFAENIDLFRNNLPVQISAADPKTINLTESNNQAVIFSPDKLSFISLNDDTEKSAALTGRAGKNIAWSAGHDKAVIGGWLYDLKQLDSKTDLKKMAPNSSDYKWSGDALYGRDKNSIYRLDPSANSAEKIFAGAAFGDYLAKNGYLYLISRANQTARLNIVSASSGQTIKEIGLPDADYAFINPEQSLLNLYDGGHGILYLIDPLSAYQPIVDIINGVKTADWANADSLLYANDFEIWLYDLSAKNKTLITRISDVITGALLHPSKNYVIYSTGRSINAIELDQREKRNSTELVKFDAINSMALNPAADTIYFSGGIGNAKGLYKFLIQ